MEAGGPPGDSGAGDFEDEWDGADDGLPVMDTCDGCGRVLELGSLYDGDDPLLSVARDSSWIDAFNPEHDGRRMLMACSIECHEQLQEHFRRRPFVWEELWAGKISRVVRQHTEGFSPQQLAQETGLKPQQVQAGFAWLEAQRRRGTFGAGGPAG